MTPMQVFSYYDPREPSGTQDLRYCPHCGAACLARAVGGRRRPVCGACGFVHYKNPAAGVATVVVQDGRVVFGRYGPATRSTLRREGWCRRIHGMTGDLHGHLRTGVATFLLRRHAAIVEVLLLRRATRRFFGHWFPVEGRIEVGETPEQAALREVREETRIAPSAFFWGQREPVLLREFGLAMYVFVGFTEPSAQVVLNGEHSAYAWLPPGEAAIRLPFPSQRAALRRICEHFILKPPEETLRVF